MKTIKIINGTFGYRRPGGIGVTPKGRSDPPFEVDDAQAARLVALKVAEYAVTRADAPAPPGGDSRLDELLALTRKELDEIAADKGLDASKCKSKREVVDLILAAGVEDEGEESDENEKAPDLTGDEDVVT